MNKHFEQGLELATAKRYRRAHKVCNHSGNHLKPDPADHTVWCSTCADWFICPVPHTEMLDA